MQIIYLTRDLFLEYTKNSSVQFSRSVVSDSLRPHGVQHARPPCPSLTPGVYSNSCPLSQSSNDLILCRPFLLLPSIFPSIRVFSNESILHIRWPKFWSFSFNISPSNERTLRTDLLEERLVESPCRPRNSQEFSPTPQFKSINSLALSFLYSPTLTSIHEYRKNHSFN